MKINTFSYENPKPVPVGDDTGSCVSKTHYLVYITAIVMSLSNCWGGLPDPGERYVHNHAPHSPLDINTNIIDEWRSAFPNTCESIVWGIVRTILGRRVLISVTKYIGLPEILRVRKYDILRIYLRNRYLFVKKAEFSLLC